MTDVEKYKNIWEKWKIQNAILTKLMLEPTRNKDKENQVKRTLIELEQQIPPEILKHLKAAPPPPPPRTTYHTTPDGRRIAETSVGGQRKRRHKTKKYKKKKSKSRKTRTRKRKSRKSRKYKR